MQIRTNLLTRVERAAAACTDLAVIEQNLQPNSVLFFCDEVQEIWQQRQTTLISINEAKACTDIEVAKHRYIWTTFASEEGRIWGEKVLELNNCNLVLPLLVEEYFVDGIVECYFSTATDPQSKSRCEQSLIFLLDHFGGTYKDLAAYEEFRKRFGNVLVYIPILSRLYEERWDQLMLPHALIDAPQCTNINTVITRMNQCIDDGKAQSVWKGRWYELALEIARTEVPACTDPAVAKQKLLEFKMPPESEAELLWREKFIELSYPE